MSAEVAHRDRWRVLGVLLAAPLLVVVDVTVLHVAVPSITEDLRPSAVQLLWIIDVYALVVAPLLVATGTLGDRIGHKRVLLTGMVVFTLASVLCALAGTTGALIGARALLGVGGAMIFPPTMAIIRNVFADRRDRVTAIGIWSAMLAGGAAIGPLVGGFLVERFHWGSVFLINVPILLVALPFAIRMLPETCAERPAPWDVVSVLLSALGVLGLVFGIQHGARYGFGEPPAFVAVAGGLAALTVFVRRQLRAAKPLLDVRLFADPTFSVAVVCVLLSMFALVGLELLFAQYLQLVLGLQPLAASVRLLPLMAATLLGGLASAKLLRRVGTRVVVVGGLSLATIALLPLLALGVDDRYVLLWPPFVGLGLALEAVFLAANDAILSAAPADRAGGAAAIEETAYELGDGLGVAVLGSVLTVAYGNALTAVHGVGGAAMQAAHESVGRAVEVADRLPARTGTALLTAAREAFVHGLHVVVLLSIALIGASTLIAALILPSNEREAAETPLSGAGH